MNLKRIYKNKTTESFKIEFIERIIIPSLKWEGCKMVYPYTWNGERKYAVVSFPKIKWDVKKL